MNKIKKLGKYDKGAYYSRTKFDDESGKREKAFSMAWRKTNKSISFLNHGYGTLQCLFTHHEKWFVRHDLIIKKRDRYIVATAIQWIGTNVGFCWLQEVLESLGYKLVKIKKAEREKRNVQTEKKDSSEVDDVLADKACI